MKKTTILLLVAAVVAVKSTKAQSTDFDASNISRIAKQDARKLRISNNDLKKLDTVAISANSDYFKPTPAYVAHPSLLSDSTYVQAFRKEAFINTLNIETASSTSSLSKMKYTSSAELAAQVDGKSLVLPHSLLKKFKKEHFPYTSDYFKPTSATTSNKEMLADSSYVKSFRYAAYNEAKHTRLHPTGHAILTTLSITLAAAIIVFGISESTQVLK